MKKFTRTALLVATLAGATFAAQAADTTAAPAPAQDPIVQHLKLTDAQVSKMKTLHQQLEKNVQAISMKDIKDGMIINMIQSGKWDEAGVNKQLAAFSKVDQQVRYYKVKYYFDLSQVLTAEQRKQVQNDLAQAAAE
ncbi:Spy/CpxP family protein refolding chaperone [Kluyvera sp. CHPC 1.2972]|uniref:Spy/CpxP family protein refolding chaperone n=1 Tax=Kluyvera sp. CHPC 1.2972 TaxID=2995176 RepID=UPI002FD85904